MSTLAKPALAIPDHQFRQILGLQFFTGSPEEAVEHMSAGGLLVVPAAPALKDLPYNPSYREALLNVKSRVCPTFAICSHKTIFASPARHSGLCPIRPVPLATRPG